MTCCLENDLVVYPWRAKWGHLWAHIQDPGYTQNPSHNQCGLLQSEGLGSLCKCLSMSKICRGPSVCQCFGLSVCVVRQTLRPLTVCGHIVLLTAVLWTLEEAFLFSWSQTSLFFLVHLGYQFQNHLMQRPPQADLSIPQVVSYFLSSFDIYDFGIFLCCLRLHIKIQGVSLLPASLGQLADLQG